MVTETNPASRTAPVLASTPDLRSQDVILVNTSAGKDSLVMLDVVVEMAREAGVLDRVVAVHCNLGRVEWKGTLELAQRQCARYAVPLYVVKRPQGDLLDHVLERGKFPGAKTRFCTAQHKRDQVLKLMTTLVDQFIDENLAGYRTGKQGMGYRGRAIRVLNCLGLRAQESEERRKKQPVERNERSNSKREITDWLPIHQWTTDEVWAHIRTRGLEYHRAYDLGMPRLSCVFCFYMQPPALRLAGYYNRSLLRQYAEVEAATGHTLRHNESLVTIEAALDAGWTPQGGERIAMWDDAQCA